MNHLSGLVTGSSTLQVLCVQAVVEQNPMSSPSYPESSEDPTPGAITALYTLKQWQLLKAQAPIGPINFPKVMRQIEKNILETLTFRSDRKRYLNFHF